MWKTDKMTIVSDVLSVSLIRSITLPKVLPLEKTQITFGFLLAYSYLCTLYWIIDE